MNIASTPSRSGSACATGAQKIVPAIDYDAHRRRAARLRAETYRRAALAVRDALVSAVRAVIAFTDGGRRTCDTHPAPAHEAAGIQRLLAIHVPHLLRANDNAIGRRSESA